MLYLKELISLRAFRPDTFDEKYSLKERAFNELVFCIEYPTCFKVGIKKTSSEFSTIQEFQRTKLTEYWEFLKEHAKEKAVVVGSSVPCIFSAIDGRDGQYPIKIGNSDLKIKVLKSDIENVTTAYSSAGLKIVRMYPILLSMATLLANKTIDRRANICVSDGLNAILLSMDNGDCVYHRLVRLGSQSDVNQITVNELAFNAQKLEAENIGFGLNPEGEAIVSSILGEDRVDLPILIENKEHLDLEVLSHDF